MEQIKKYKIAVIGGGPAGTFLVYLLHKNGFNVTLFESRLVPKRKVCGEYLSPAGVNILADKNLILPNNFLNIDGMKIVTPWNTSLIGDFPSQKNKIFLGKSVMRDEFDLWLIDETKKTGANINLGHTLRSFQWKENKWQLYFNDENEVPHQIDCDILIGADGRQSTVAKLLNWENARDYSMLALHAYLAVKGPQTRRGQMHLLGNGFYIGLDPVRENELNVSLIISAKELKKYKSVDDCMTYFWNSRLELIKEFGTWQNVKIFSVAPITHSCHTIASAHAALIGDAAGFLDPLTGEGIYNGLKSASLLAETLLTNKPNWHLLYSEKYQQIIGRKKRINLFFQWVIQLKWPMKLMEIFLKFGANRIHHFIGLIGNVWGPLEGFIKIILNSTQR